MSYLIADGGSTSTKWALVDLDTPEQVTRFTTAPLNPVHTDARTICHELDALKNTHLADVRVDSINYYGSGCTPQGAAHLSQLMRRHFYCRISVKSDVVGAARALWGGEAGRGVACIIGTGSIAARVQFADLYTSWQQYFQAPECDVPSSVITPAASLGYILGDEGSGAWLGRQFLSDYFKGQMPEAFRRRIAADHPDLTAASVIEYVYRQPLANRYLGSMVPILLDYSDDPYVETLVRRGFADFFRRNVLPAAGNDTELLQDVRFVGSIAVGLRPWLESVAADFGCRVTRVLSDPLDGMVRYTLAEERVFHQL